MINKHFSIIFQRKKEEISDFYSRALTITVKFI